MRSTGSRSDAVANREKLLAAAERLLGTSRSFSLVNLSEEAGVSTATTYRNFSSPQAAIDAYLDDLLSQFEADTAEIDTLHGVTMAWARLVDLRGVALVHIRSTEGFLARVRRNDPVIIRMDRVVRRALQNDPRVGDLDDADIDYLVFVWNLFFDTREVLDLTTDRGLTIETAAEELLGDFWAVIEHRSKA